MKINYLKYCTFFVLYLITTTLPAQNYVYNGGFESGDAQGAQNSLSTPNSSTIPYLDNWEKADNKNDHSPDWWRKGAPSFNFQTPNAQTHDDNYFYPSSPPYNFYYSSFLPHTGYGMAGLYSHELIQQKINSAALGDAINNSSWNSITLKMWVRMANRHTPINDKTLKVFLSKSNMKYKEKELPCSESDFRTYNSTNRLEILSIPNVGLVYPRGEWHLITKVYNIPGNVSNIGQYDWIVIDMASDNCIKDYIFIDDIELTVGCSDNCNTTDGEVEPYIPSNFIAGNNLFKIDNVQNANSVRLEVYMVNGGAVLFDETISCINGVDHALYYDGTIPGGAPIPNATYGYRLTTYNDCGQQKFKGTFKKITDYTGPQSTNFNVPCTNGVNPTPEPCCWIDPNMYINNTTLVGPDPSWSKYIIPLNIWACTDQSDFSDWVKVEHDAKVLFRAGRQVTLREGFHTERGATFCAEIKPCPRPKDTGRGENTDGGARFSDPEEIEEVVETPELVNGIKVYPNPTTGLVNIDLSTFYVEDKTYQLSIYNVLGERLQSFEVNTSTLTVQLQGQPEGIYLIEVSDGVDQYIVKLIKN